MYGSHFVAIDNTLRVYLLLHLAGYKQFFLKYLLISPFSQLHSVDYIKQALIFNMLESGPELDKHYSVELLSVSVRRPILLLVASIKMCCISLILNNEVRKKGER